MRKVATCLAVVLLACGPAFAGVVTFSPNPIEIDRNVSTLGALQVSASGNGEFDGIDLVIGGDSVTVTGFSYDAGFVSATSFRAAPNLNFGNGVYGAGHSVYVGGFLANSSSAPILVGTLNFDAAGLPDGDYSLGVSSSRDGGLSGIGLFGENDASTSGSVTIHVVPEPATLSLLGLGVLGLIRRRFAA